MSTACDPGETASSARAAAEDLLNEIKRLKKENEYLKRQREILKKAARILAEDPHLNRQPDIFAKNIPSCGSESIQIADPSTPAEQCGNTILVIEDDLIPMIPRAMT